MNKNVRTWLLSLKKAGIKRLQLIYIYLFISILPAYSSVNSNQSLLTLNLTNKSLKTILKEIENKSDYVFFFSDEINPLMNKKMSIHVTNATLDQVMKDITEKSQLAYTVVDNQVSLIRSQGNTHSTQIPLRDVTGTIIDEKDEPVVGVNVWVKETTNGTVTDLTGKFKLEISGYSTVLVISFLGYETVEIEVRDRSEIGTIKISPAVGALEEVVVVGFGRQKKESVIGSISTINPKDLKVPTSQISNILAGRLAGVVSVNRSGEPGSGAEFYIRGISTFGANRNPLVLVDGVERSLDLVDPEDIASFSILKDATATAVYGVRGANGVILITTRSGTEGKPKINIRYEQGLAGPAKLPKMVDAIQFAEMYNEASGAEYFTDKAIRAYRDGSNPDVYPNVNWIDNLYKDFAQNERLNVNFSGGASIAKYYIAGSLYNEGSIFKNENDTYDSSLNYNKINFRANVDLNITKSTLLKVNLANVYERRRRPGVGLNEIWDYTFSMSPNAIPIRFSNGKLAGSLGGENPYNLLNYSGYSNDYWNSAQSLVGLTQDLGDLITPGLTANVKFSWDAYNSGTVSRRLSPETWQLTGVDENENAILSIVSQGNESLSYARSLDGRRSSYLEASLAYDRTFGLHRVGGLLLYNQKQLNYLNASDALGSLPYKNQGIAGRFTYSYNDNYFLEYNMGYNGSENFAPGHRFGFFPAVAVGWMISNEKFWEPVKSTVGGLKLRASYGVVGNDQIGGGRRFIYQETILTGNSYLFGETGGYNPGSIKMGDWPNSSVSWEKSYKLNLGTEITLFNMLKMEADYFKDKREGIFLQRASLPNSVGVSVLPWVNLGEMENKGFDGTIQLNKKAGEFNFTAMGNFTYSKNKIINNDQPDYQYAYQDRRGKPYNQPFGLIALGLFQSQEEIDNSPTQFGTLKVGDIKYKDVNEDKVIDQLDEVAIGYTVLPQIVYGFGGTAEWRGIDISVFFQGVGKTSIQMNGSPVYGFSGISVNISRAGLHEEVYLNRWSESNQDPNAKYPRIDIAENPNNNRLSTLRLRDGSFMRLKNFEIGYTFPKKTVEKLQMSSLRVYASGINVLTFSKFKTWDPELGNGDGSTYPINRSFNLGVNINF